MLATIHSETRLEDRALLQAAGLQPRRLLDGAAGAVFKRKPGQEVRRIDTGAGAIYFCKRSKGPSIRTALRAVRAGRLPHTSAYEQFLAARALEAAGFRVMTIAMAGSGASSACGRGRASFSLATWMASRCRRF